MVVSDKGLRTGLHVRLKNACLVVHIGGPSARGKFPVGEAEGNRVLKVSRGAGGGSPRKKTLGVKGRKPPAGGCRGAGAFAESLHVPVWYQNPHQLRLARASLTALRVTGTGPFVLTHGLPVAGQQSSLAT